MQLFVCDVCEGMFHDETPPGKAEAEYLRNFTDEERKKDRSKVCDDCYGQVMEHMEKRRSRN